MRARHFPLIGLAGVFGLLGFASLLGAQAQSESPEEVVRRFFQSEVEARWLDAAQFLDLDTFESMRKSAVANARHPQRGPALTVDQLMQFDPNMPRAVAEYQLKDMNRDRTNEFLEREYARINSIDELAALSIREAAARWLEAKDVRWQMSLAMKYSRSNGRKVPKCPPADSAALMMAKEMARNSAQIVATAYEKSDSIVYVLVRDRYRLRRTSGLDDQAAIREIPPSIVTLVRGSKGWKIYPAYDLPSPEGVQNVSVSLACESKGPAPQ
jgi:hypothetical protein